MLYLLVATCSFFMLCSAQNRNCIDDLDLNEPRGVQVYDYAIKPDNWTEIRETSFDDDDIIAWNRNFYIFGKFVDDSQSGPGDTTITAGLYRGEKLIYKTVINCEKGTWENWILNKYEKLKMIHHGDLDKPCKAGEAFDLIHKNDNLRLANWIFNAQALQHGVRGFDRKMGKAHNGTFQTRYTLRPLVKIDSKYSVYTATRFAFKATGKAFIDRLVFGQCDAWPKGMEMQCQKVREWLHARSKANLTETTLAQTRENGDKNFGYGLGVFGNNNPHFIPRCITDKYFDWMQKIVHPNKELPLLNLSEEEKRKRAYCCCINMKTGKIFDNDPVNNCARFSTCETEHWNCLQAYDREIGKEIYEEGLEAMEAQEKAKAHVADKYAKRPSFVQNQEDRAKKTLR